MLDPKITTTNYAAVFKTMRTYDDRVVEAGYIAIAAGMELAVSISQNEYLAGPRPKKLGEVTGRLRRSIVARTDKTASGVVGRIGTNIPYGRYHELGFRGVIDVKAHVRHVQDVFASDDDRRKVIRDAQGNKVGLESAKRAMARGIDLYAQNVRGHQRKVDYAGKPFLRPALAKAMPLILARLKKELEGKGS